MSLHVPGGLLLTGRAADPLALPAALKPVLLDVADRLFHEALAARVAHHIDRVRLGLPGLVEAPAPASALGALSRQVAVETVAAIRDDRARYGQADLAVTVTILGHPDRDDALLGIVHAERCELRDAVLAIDGIDEYAYVAVDSPRLGAHEWQERARVWSHALRDGRYADLGWTWSLFGRYPEQTLRCLAVPDTNKLVAALPAETDRARHLAGVLGNTRPMKDMNDVAAFQRRHEGDTASNLPTALAALAPITADDLA
ncbi:hypothetical protein ASE38_13525 [Cellulomonas sp. Root930]|nr:hypothetical protein ASE38_13525 [Cellulomonas sp. Root930]